MQRIQPQMDAIKEKYKKYKINDPKRNEMNVEIMKLQKDNGVNMFGGCIPTLIQLPLLFAFFSMLPKVVELRHAHWGWLPDLTAPDPYHILPIVMVVSQFLMQYYTPSPGVDPQQQKMMAFMMPAVTGYFACELWLGPRTLLGGRQLLRDCAAVGDEPHLAGQGDARDCRQTRSSEDRSARNDTREALTTVVGNVKRAPGRSLFDSCGISLSRHTCGVPSISICYR